MKIRNNSIKDNFLDRNFHCCLTTTQQNLTYSNTKKISKIYLLDITLFEEYERRKNQIMKRLLKSNQYENEIQRIVREMGL